MLILDTEQKTETPTLSRILRDWWAKLKAWLRRQSLAEDTARDETDGPDHLSSLIL